MPQAYAAFPKPAQMWPLFCHTLETTAHVSVVAAYMPGITARFDRYDFVIRDGSETAIECAGRHSFTWRYFLLAGMTGL